MFETITIHNIHKCLLWHKTSNPNSKSKANHEDTSLANEMHS